MTVTRRRGIRWLIACAITAGYAFGNLGAQQPPKSPVNPKRVAPPEFVERVKDYMALHQKLEATLPKLPKEATPQQIDTDQREIGRAHV